MAEILTAADLTPAELARLLARIPVHQDPDACREWTGARMGGSHPYGQIRVRGVLLYTHRLAYERHHGRVPDGIRVLHRCDNPPCCHEDHLFTGTAGDNTRDMMTKQRGAYVAHRGSSNGFAKLTEQDVRQIYAMSAEGGTQTAIAAAFGVTQANISLILRGDSWKHLAPAGRVSRA